LGDTEEYNKELIMECLKCDSKDLEVTKYRTTCRDCGTYFVTEEQMRAYRRDRRKKSK
jgi:hypothetical protein